MVSLFFIFKYKDYYFNNFKNIINHSIYFHFNPSPTKLLSPSLFPSLSNTLHKQLFQLPSIQQQSQIDCCWMLLNLCFQPWFKFTRSFSVKSPKSNLSTEISETADINLLDNWYNDKSNVTNKYIKRHFLTWLV